MKASLETLDALRIGAAALDSECRILGCNASFASALGADAKSVIGKDLVEALTVASQDVAGTGPAAAYRLGAGESARWYRAEIRTAKNATIVVLNDVDAERNSVEDLRNFYATRDRLLLDGKIGTWRFDPDAALFQFSSELNLGHEQASRPVPLAMLQTIQHPEDREKDAAIRERITRDGGTANAEMRYREANGNWTHLLVHYRSGRRTQSGLYEIFGISQDITPVASARDEAQQFSRRLNLALNAAQAGVFGYSYFDNSYWVSEEFTALVGEEALARIRDDPYSLFVPEDREHARVFIATAGLEPGSNSLDLRMDAPGGPKWVRLYFNVEYRDRNGNPLRGTGLLLDIDERKRQEIALFEAQRRAEYANRTKTEFLANMSHELRTPLNAILGFSEIIKSELFGPVGARYLDYANDIHRSGQHLLALVNDVLDLSKLEAGKLELHESEVAIAPLVEECLALVRGRAAEGRVLLFSHCSGTPARLRADERAVRQLLLNFLSNAVKFTPAGGRVDVRASCDAAGAIVLTVSDTGIGMNELEIDVALSPFGQIDSKLARKHEGTGLGLPICKSLMELHGGTLTVASKPNAGTTLTARFPVSRTIGAPAVAAAR